MRSGADAGNGLTVAAIEAISRTKLFNLFLSLFGRVAEWTIAAVLKTVDGDEPSVGSNPTSSANGGFV